MYQKVIQCCLDDEGDEECRKAAKELAETLQEEVDSWCRKPHLERFQMTPRVSWERQLMMAGCHAHNVLDWKRDHDPPWCHSPTRVWLLPSQDEQAEMIAEHETKLWQNGWKVIGNKPELLATLRDKSELHRLAERVGRTSAMPAQYKTPAEAQFPCIVKPARGTWGKDTIVAYSAEEIVRTARRNKLHEVERLTEQRIEYEQQCWKMSHPNDEIDDEWNESMREQVDDACNEFIEEAAHEELGDGWVLQELLEGKYEYSTTLLVKDGEILDYACTRYTFASDTYVWPALDYNIWDYVSVPAKHLAVFVDFMAGFSGICNFNYKIRKNGDMGIFEINPRVGGDLAFDMPKKRMRAMLEKLDRMF
jgi:predicted ATP-grasp superfamily ATP-dependent carboligase